MNQFSSDKQHNSNRQGLIAAVDVSTCGQAGVAYIKETQNGHGVCAVSANYAAELKRASASQASATLVITSGSNHHEGNDELM